MAPPSLVVMLQRLKPVAIRCSSLGAGQQVAGQLLDREAVEGHVLIEGLDDPIAIGPDLAVIVEVDAVAVGIAGGVEPVAGPMFAPMRRLHQAVGQLLVGLRRRVVDKGLDHLRRRRQAGQIETQPPGQRAAVGLGGRLQAALLQGGQHETIDRVADPACVLYGGQGGPNGRDERPQRLVLGPGRDPGLEPLLLGRRELLVDRRRRHDFVFVRGEDAADHLAFVRLARRDGARLDGHLPPVEPQIGLARGAVRPVAGKAVLGQDRPHVAIEAQLLGRRGKQAGNITSNAIAHRRAWRPKATGGTGLYTA